MKFMCPFCGSSSANDTLDSTWKKCSQCRKLFRLGDKKKQAKKTDTTKPFTPKKTNTILEAGYPESTKPLSPRKTTTIFDLGRLDQVYFLPANLPKKKWWQTLLTSFLVICSVLLVILLLIAGSIFVASNLNIATALIGFSLGGGVLAFVIHYLLENADVWEARRDEKLAEQAKKDMRKKQIYLNKEVEKLTNTIRKEITRRKPIENILQRICVKDHKALANAIIHLDSLSDSEKGRLFLKMDADFISNVLTHFSISDKMLILQQLDPKKREDVLFRFSLSHREELLKQLKV